MRTTIERRMTLLLSATVAALWSADAGAYMPDRDWGRYLSGEWASVAADQAGRVYVCTSTGKGGFNSVPAYKSQPQGVDVLLFRFDPDGTRIWSTYLGGPANDECRHLAIDSAGGVVVVGETWSGTGIAGPDALMFAPSGASDGFAIRVDADGQPTWGTYVGGLEDDRIHGAAFDPDDNLYLAAAGGPLALQLPGAHDDSFNGARDIALLKLSADNELLWGTYVGGSDDEFIPTVAAGADAVYLTGETRSTAGIATPGAHQTALGDPSGDAFVASFDPDGMRLWATYFGGETHDFGQSIGVMPDGGAALFGLTTSFTGIATPGAFQLHNATEGYGHGVDGMIARFDPAGALLWATYVGALNNEGTGSGAVDPAGNLLILLTNMGGGLATPDAYQPKAYNWNDWELAVVKFDPDGARRWGTYVGGEGNESATPLFSSRPIAAGTHDSVYVVARTYSEQNIHYGVDWYPLGTGAFVTKLIQGAGTPCADASECETGFCVDGLCCDGPCEAGMCGDGMCVVPEAESTGDDTGGDTDAVTSTGEMSEETGVDSNTGSASTGGVLGSTGEPASTGGTPSTSTTAATSTGTTGSTGTDPVPSTTGEPGETGDDPGAPTTSAGADEGSTGAGTSGPASGDDAPGCAGSGCSAQGPAPGGLLVLGLLARRRRRRAG